MKNAIKFKLNLQKKCFINKQTASLDSKNYNICGGGGGERNITNIKLKISSQYTIAPAYNKGAYQVIGKNNIKDIGK